MKISTSKEEDKKPEKTSPMVQPSHLEIEANFSMTGDKLEHHQTEGKYRKAICDETRQCATHHQ